MMQLPHAARASTKCAHQHSLHYAVLLKCRAIVALTYFRASRWVDEGTVALLVTAVSGRACWRPEVFLVSTTAVAVIGCWLRGANGQKPKRLVSRGSLLRVPTLTLSG